MSFKQKNRKKIISDNRVTLDAKHNDKISAFDENKKINLINIEEINKIKENNEKLLNTHNKNLSHQDLEKKLLIQDKLNLLNNKIEFYKNNNEDVYYLLNTGKLLFQYYDTMNTKDSPLTYVKKKNDKNKKSVMEFFQKSPLSQNSVSASDNSNSPLKKSRANIYEEYLSKIDENFVPSNNNEEDMNICYECNIEKIIYLSDGFMVCSSCGNQEYILIDSDKPSYKDPPREVSYFAYKRINHFNEWLAQFQAKESTDIPQDVYDQILVELKKERIENMVDLSPVKLREILKKLKKNKYYEHVPHIINRLNGVPPPIMSPEKEEELRRMFKEIQIPFHKFCPKVRKNFLSYSYVLHKFVQLLELDEFLPCFMLLKSREKLHQQDLIWKKICEYLKWEFIPSL